MAGGEIETARAAPQFDVARHCQLRSEEFRHACHGFSGPNLTMSVDSDCPALDTPRFVSPFPNVSAGPGVRDVRLHCAGMHS